MTKSVDRPDGDRLPRGIRRKLETRAKLIDAASRVMGRKGVAAATIAEIAEEADVGFGSFYNHFASKEEIAGAVVRSEAEELGRIVDELTAGLEDPALVLCAAILYTIRRVRGDELWGWFLVRAAWTIPEFQETLGRRLARDIIRGVELGRFDVPHATMTIELAATSILSAMRIGLEGRSPPDGDRILVEVVLRILGFSVETARHFLDGLPGALASKGLSALGAGFLPGTQGGRPLLESEIILLTETKPSSEAAHEGKETRPAAAPVAFGPMSSRKDRAVTTHL